jgi:molybdopterin converting factor subunit 1
VKVRVRLFAVARELAGSELIELSLAQNSTIGGLRQALTRQIPALEQVLPHVLFAVDSNYVHDDFTLSESCEVACIPPVSGG